MNCDKLFIVCALLSMLFNTSTKNYHAVAAWFCAAIYAFRVVAQ